MDLASQCFSYNLVLFPNDANLQCKRETKTLFENPRNAQTESKWKKKRVSRICLTWYKQRIWHKRTMKNKCHRGSKGIQLMTWAQIQILHIIPMQNISPPWMLIRLIENTGEETLKYNRNHSHCQSLLNAAYFVTKHCTIIIKIGEVVALCFHFKTSKQTRIVLKK